MQISEIYENTSDLIDSAQLRGVDIVSFVDKMRTDLNDSEIFTDDDNKEKLENYIVITSNRLSSNNVSYITQMLKL